MGLNNNLDLVSNRQFQDLCEILQVKPDAKFISSQLRVQNRVELATLLAPAFPSRKADELMEHIHRKKIPAGIIQTVREALTMDEIQDSLLNVSGLKGIRGFVANYNNLKSSATDNDILPPPHFGEHNQQILDSLQ